MMFFLPMLIVAGINMKILSNAASFPLSNISAISDHNRNSTPSTVGKWAKYLGMETTRISKKILKDIGNAYAEASRYVNSDLIGTMELREIVAQKVFEAASVRSLNRLLFVANSSKNARLQALVEIEYYIRQNETAKIFMEIGGIDFVFQYVNDDVPSVASAALSVLTTAMLVNPDIQNYMEELHFMEYILIALSRSDFSSVPGALRALGNYLRDMPNHQVEFLYSNGLAIIGNILKYYRKPVVYKVKVISLLGDLAREFNNFPEYLNGTLKEDLQRFYANTISANEICDEIPYYLNYEGYIHHEMVVAAMDALSHICYEEFSKADVIQSVEKLKEFYNPNKIVNLYSSTDLELISTIHKKLENLLQKIAPKTVGSVLEKTEL